MRRTTALLSQWQADTKTGETLTFEICKGGYFSNKKEYGLKVVGKTVQNGTPSPDTPIPVQCVKQGTKIKTTGKNVCKISRISSSRYGDLISGNYGTTINSIEPTDEIIVTQTQYPMEDNVSYFENGVFYIYIENLQEYYKQGYRKLSFDFEVTNNPLNSLDISLLINNISGFRTLWTALPSNKGRMTVSLLDFEDIYYNNENNITFNNGGKSLKLSNFQLEKDNFTEYEPYISYSEITVPCDLYEGDVWYPTSGIVERRNKIKVITGYDESFYYIWASEGGQVFASVNKLVDVELHPDGKFIGVSCSILSGIAYDAWPDGIYNYNHNDNYPYLIAINYKNNAGLVYIKNVNYTNASEFMNWLKSLSDSGNPLTFVYQTNKVELEQYEPQPLFCFGGTVSVTQNPTELAADLTATMLKK